MGRHEPGTNGRERVSRVLEQVAGVDLNPFAAAIARFRLSIAALRASGVHHLADAPAFGLHVAAGDSLLHGPRPGLAGTHQEYLDPDHDPLSHVYRTEDADALREMLGRRYHVVVGTRRTSRRKTRRSIRGTASASVPAIASTRSPSRLRSASSTSPTRLRPVRPGPPAS